MCEMEKCDCGVVDYRFVIDDQGRIIDGEGEIPPIKIDFAADEGSEPGVVDAITLMRFMNENFHAPLDWVDENVIEPALKMDFIFVDESSYYSEAMFREVQERINFESDPHLLYVFFDMGSVVLDILNPANYVMVYHDFIEVFNANKLEHTWIKSSEIKGFVLEPNMTEEMEEAIDEVLEND